MDVAIDFNQFLGQGVHPCGNRQLIQVRRLSTPSYGMMYLARVRGEEGAVVTEKPEVFHTLWVWYYKRDDAWCKFEEDGVSPMQSIIETKNLTKQEVFRFVIPPEPAKGGSTFLLSFIQNTVLRVETQQTSVVKRRPVFVSSDDIINKKWLAFPQWKHPSYLPTLPENWFPINPAGEFELIPLNPNSMEYHLVASEFVRSMDGRVIDVFRVQNPFLWNKYNAKKQFMKDRLGDPNELQLFHGTSNEGAVQSILRQNFDWRLCGKNATYYGRGSYFARDASFSSKYSAHNNQGPFKWMFMARMLAGRYIRGNKDYNRPPPLDPGNPYGDIYDSCVDDMNNAKIYVVFDSDQCYPEYLFSYR